VTQENGILKVTVEMPLPPVPSVRKKIPSWLLPALGYVLSAVSLIWVFRGFDWRHALDDFASLDWRYVTIAVIFDLGVYVCHGWRWTLVVQPIMRAKLWRTVQAVYIGLYANEILPLRTGEIIRCYLFAHWNKLHLPLVLSSAAIERILDGIFLFLALIAVSFVLPVPGYLIEGGRIMGLVVFLLMLVLIYVGQRREEAKDAMQRSRIGMYLHELVDGIHAMGNPRSLLAASGASILYVVLQVVPIWALIEAYDLKLPVWASAVVFVILRLGTVIPNAPGNTGLYQFFVVLALGLFDVPKSTAVGFSLMMFGVLTLPLLIGGFVAVALTGLKLDQIREQARISMDARNVTVSSPSK
jgi:uncharacterized protein (TIRG00374 family)